VTADPGSAADAHPRLAALIARASAGAPLATGVVYPCEATALDATLRAAAQRLIAPVLYGPGARIAAVAAELGQSLAGLRMIETGDDPVAAARAAVADAAAGTTQALMKGSLHTDELLAAVVSRDSGLRRGRRMSHVFMFDLPRYHKLLAVTDAVISIAPDAKAKAAALGNASEMLRAFGIARPKVAIVAAVETVNPQIPATLDARELVDLAAAGEFGDCLVEGPFGFDNAFSSAAARTKGIQSAVAGDADLLLVPDLNAGNMLYKSFIYVGGGECAGVVLGAAVPVILTSRADSLFSRLASCALASVLAPAAPEKP